GISATGHRGDIDVPRLRGPRIGGLAQFDLCTLSLREQGYRSGFPQEWKTLGYQSLKRSDRARSNDVGGGSKLRSEILDSCGRQAARSAGDALRLAKERRLFCIAVDEMDERARLVGEGAGNHQAGKSSPRAKIEPNPRARGQVEKL